MKSVAAVVLVFLAPSMVLGYAADPPNGTTGAPGEGTCRDCHASFGLNSGSGLLAIGAPDAFEAGMTYPIVVTIEQAGQSRWGFEFTPLTIGTCTPVEPTVVQIQTQGGRTYVKQTAAGTYNGIPNAGAWAFTWTAPSQPPDVVTFYVSGNAANGNGSTSGDYIYTASLQVPLAQGADDCSPLPDQEVLFSSPNPIRDRAVITYRIAEPSEVHLGIYDMAGSLVACVVSEWRPAGTWSILWDASHVHAAGGIYLCRLSAGASARVRPLVVVR